MNDILENERKYSQNAIEIDEAINDLTEYGPPHHAWGQVALHVVGVAEQQAHMLKQRESKKSTPLSKKTWMPMHTFFSGNR